ncbi:MAG TPA: hypothetical protein VHI13_16645 [Candidatus Kapabacteria bacterium]|nr:hypothetical protein [Candidatus Kapabacteria bacterium]
MTAGLAGLVWALLAPQSGVRPAIVLSLSMLLILEPVVRFNYCIDDGFVVVTAIPFVALGVLAEWHCIRLVLRARSARG